jgi:hypothetical protein
MSKPLIDNLSERKKILEWAREFMCKLDPRQMGHALYCEYSGDDHSCYFINSGRELWFDHRFKNLKDGKVYSIFELCKDIPPKTYDLEGNLIEEEE